MSFNGSPLSRGTPEGRPLIPPFSPPAVHSSDNPPPFSPAGVHSSDNPPLFSSRGSLIPLYPISLSFTTRKCREETARRTPAHSRGLPDARGCFHSPRTPRRADFKKHRRVAKTGDRATTTETCNNINTQKRHLPSRSCEQVRAYLRKKRNKKQGQTRPNKPNHLGSPDKHLSPHRSLTERFFSPWPRNPGG